MKSLFKAVFFLSAFVSFGETAAPLGVEGIPEEGFSAVFQSFEWKIDGSMEIRGLRATGKPLLLKISGLFLPYFPAQKITSFSGESQFLPDGPAHVIKFFDKGSQQVGLIELNFRFRYPPVGNYRISPGKLLKPQSPSGSSECAVLLTPDSGRAISVLPGGQVPLEIGASHWIFVLSRAAVLVTKAQNDSSIESPSFSADFYSFEIQ